MQLSSTWGSAPDETGSDLPPSAAMLRRQAEQAMAVLLEENPGRAPGSVLRAVVQAQREALTRRTLPALPSLLVAARHRLRESVPAPHDHEG